MTGVVIEKIGSRSVESYIAGTSPYYVLDMGDVEPRDRSAAEGVILRPTTQAGELALRRTIGQRVRVEGYTVRSRRDAPAPDRTWEGEVPVDASGAPLARGGGVVVTKLELLAPEPAAVGVTVVTGAIRVEESRAKTMLAYSGVAPGERALLLARQGVSASDGMDATLLLRSDDMRTLIGLDQLGGQAVELTGTYEPAPEVQPDPMTQYPVDPSGAALRPLSRFNVVSWRRLAL